MKTWITVVRIAVIALTSLLCPLAAGAIANPDEPAAVVVYPYIVVDVTANKDTLIQLTNTSAQAVEARCFYENFTPECTSGQPDATCLSGPVTCTGVCIPRDSRIPLRVRMTAGQPLAWRASSGLPQPPIEETQTGSASNQFTTIPALGNGPFLGTLRCTAVEDDPLRPSRNNVLVGQATIEQSNGPPSASANTAQYRAVGVKAVDDGPNRDEFLVFGGPTREYEACPAYASLNHFFDGSPVHAGDSTAVVTTDLVLANCTSTPPATAANVVQFLVYNGFDQRFSTSKAVDGQLISRLSRIDSADPTRSIFWYQVSGTLGGHSIIRGINAGVHAVAIESHTSGSESAVVHSDAINSHGYGARLQGDTFSYRPPLCIGDCNFDGNVTIDEVILGVTVALDEQTVAACPVVDANGDSQVTIDEIVRAVIAAADGCPQAVAPTPAPTATPIPVPSPPTSAGPDITHFGLATAADRPLQADSFDDMGRPVFVRPYGQGLVLIMEARPGVSNRSVGGSTFSTTGGVPDLQVLVSRPLGDGNAEVCEQNGLSGGIPAVPGLDFSPDSSTVAAINDLGCRAYDNPASPTNPCTRIDGGTFGTVSPVSKLQFCIPIAKAWAFPLGDTIVAARVRDTGGGLSAVSEIVVRVQH
ncbi:MAG: hypothetical protein HY270_09840 [Deltaproteobacteria bacterium]|nr:hypothetical protein [Deltaproteobacteria bacterium]